MPIQNDQDAGKIARAIADPATPAEDKQQLMAALQEYDASHTGQANDKVPTNEQPDPNSGSSSAFFNPYPSEQAGRSEITKGLIRAPLTFAEGAGQAATRVAAKLGDAKDAQFAKDYDEAVKAERSGVSPGAILTGEMASTLMPGGAAANAPRAGRLLAQMFQWGSKTIKAGAVGATVGGTSHFAEGDESKLSEAAWGAAFPMAFQAVAGVLPSMRNAIATWIQGGESARNAQTRAAAEQFFTGSRAVPDPAPLTPAQQTGNPVLTSLEQRARGSEMQELNATQQDQVRDRFNELADQAAAASGGRATPGRIAQRSYTTVDALDSQMRTQRNGEFESGMADVVRMSRQNNSRVPLDSLRRTYADILAEDANPFNVQGTSLPPTFRRAHQLLDDMNRQGFQPTVENVATIMKGLSQGAGRDSAILSTADARLEMYRARLWGALNQDLDHAAGNIPPNSIVPMGTRVLGMNADPAFLRLQEVRGLYARRSATLDRLQNDSINQIFGSQEVLATPQAALNKFYQLPAADQTYAVHVLGMRSPEVLAAMQANRIRGALQAATRLGPANTTTFDSRGFTNAMFNGENAAANSRLFSPEQRAIFQQGAARLQILMNHLPTSGGGSIVWPEEMAINMVSRNPAFVARIAARMAYGRYGDQLLGTAEGLNALRTLTAIEKPTGQATSAAVAWMLAHINDEQQQNGKQQNGGQ